MNKLTAESALQELTKLKVWGNDGVLTLKEERYLQALEIALPILEQQDHEKSIIACQLEAVRDSLSLTPHQDAIIRCAIDRLNVLTLRTLELSQSLIKQQGRSEGEWIDWGGKGQPANDPMVEVRFRDGELDKGFASHWVWRHSDSEDDIIAYRIIPERATNQNGEQ